MSDIEMCGQDCPVSETCKRHADSGTVPHETWQSYGEHEPEKGKECEWYWEIHND